MTYFARDREDAKPQRPRSERKGKKTRKAARRNAGAGEGSNAVERELPVSIPRYVLAHADNFEVSWHLALWAPNDPQGPAVFINVDSPILQEVVEYHQEQYPDVYAEDVADTVRKVFG